MKTHVHETRPQGYEKVVRKAFSPDNNRRARFSTPTDMVVVPHALSAEELLQESRPSRVLAGNDARYFGPLDNPGMVGFFDIYGFVKDPSIFGKATDLQFPTPFEIFSDATMTGLTVEEAEYLTKQLKRKQRLHNADPSRYRKEEEERFLRFHEEFPRSLGIEGEVCTLFTNSGTETDHSAIQLCISMREKENARRLANGEELLNGGVILVEFPESASGITDAANGANTYPYPPTEKRFQGKPIEGLHFPDGVVPLYPVMMSAAYENTGTTEVSVHDEACYALLKKALDEGHVIIFSCALNKRGGWNGNIHLFAALHANYGNQVLFKCDLCQDPSVVNLNDVLNMGGIIQISTGKRLGSGALGGVTIAPKEFNESLPYYFDLLQKHFGTIPDDLHFYTPYYSSYPPAVWKHALLQQEKMQEPDPTMSLKLDSNRYVQEQVDRIDAFHYYYLQTQLAHRMREVLATEIPGQRSPAKSLYIHEVMQPGKRTNQLINIGVQKPNGDWMSGADLEVLQRLMTQSLGPFGAQTLSGLRNAKLDTYSDELRARHQEYVQERSRIEQIMRISHEWAQECNLDLPVYLAQPETALGDRAVLRIGINRKLLIYVYSVYKLLEDAEKNADMSAQGGGRKRLRRMDQQNHEKDLLNKAVEYFIEHSFRPALIKLDTLVSIFPAAKAYNKRFNKDPAPKVKKDWKKQNKEVFGRLNFTPPASTAKIFGV